MSVDVVGKISVVAIPASEAMEKLGWVVNADIVQIIAAVGALVMITDKIIRLVWTKRDRARAQKLARQSTK